MKENEVECDNEQEKEGICYVYMLEISLVGNLKKQEICDGQRMTPYEVEMA